jgi:hypothetical protein
MMTPAPRKRRRKMALGPVNAASESQGNATPATPAESDLRGEGGSLVDAFNMAILRETLACIWPMGPESEKREKRILTAITALHAFKPQDEIEGMVAAQAVALHFGAMEALRRSMIDGQPAEIAARFRKDGANMARAMTDMIDALDRKRGKVHQLVRVERVVVEDGGQAIVGAVNGRPEGGGKP